MFVQLFVFILMISYLNSALISHDIDKNQLNEFHECHKQYQAIDEDLFDCIAYKLLLNNVERLDLQDMDDNHQLIKPVLTKTFENKTVKIGENVTFTCETQNGAVPVFLFYKLNSNADKATFLQDPDGFGYESAYPRIKLERRQHTKDPNRDVQSEFESINLRLFNTVIDDTGFYLCIVTNSARTYRSTYSYLNVTAQQQPVQISPTTADSNDYDEFMNNIINNIHRPNDKFDKFIKNHKHAIVIGSIVSVIFILFIMLLIMYCCSSRMIKRKFLKQDSAKSDVGKLLESEQKLPRVNSIIEKTMHTMRKNFVYVAMEGGNGNSVNSTLSQRVNLLNSPNDACDLYVNQNAVEFTDDVSEWEFPRDKLKLGKMIDEGAFGRVYMADAYGIVSGRYKSVVAVKTLKENPSKLEFTNFIKELEIMRNVGKHENIISLLGCCTQNGPIYAIVEYAKFGNLRNYLRSQRPKDYLLSTTMDSETETENTDTTLSSNIKKLYSSVHKKNSMLIDSNAQKATSSKALLIELIRFCTQIANGMKYLHSKKVCHRDLAARNILLDENKDAKIADFGLARDLNDGYYYKRKSESKVPVKWMAPETLFDHKVYPNSDIWSFGVLAWEVFTLGGNPYPSVPVEKLFDYLKEGNRMSKPMYCDDEIYGIILDCWNFRSDQRPSFSTIHEKLLYILEKHETELANETLNINLNTPTLSLNFSNMSNIINGSTTSSKEFLSGSTILPCSPKQCSNFDLNKQILLKRFTNSNDINRILNEKRLTRQSESDDSQYFSGTDMSNSLLYVDSSNFSSSSASSHYSAYEVTPHLQLHHEASMKAASIMASSLAKRPPSPPPPNSIQTLLNVASKAYEL